jgi:cobalt-zinc-cadmium efflux system outer membrane protein
MHCMSLSLCLLLGMMGGQVIAQNPPTAPPPQSLPDAPSAQTGTSASVPQMRGAPPSTAGTSAVTRISLEDAIKLALTGSPAIRAARAQIAQSQAQEVTADFRPNPVLSWDAQFVPIFSPGQFSTDTLNNIQQFDVGVSYLFERGGKRGARYRAAVDQTTVTRAQVRDAERTLTFNVAQQFINALLAQSTLQFAQQDLSSFQNTVRIGEERYRVGDISEGDLLKIKLQTLQFQTDVSAARVALVQALAGLRQLVGYEALPENFQLVGDLVYEPFTSNLDKLNVTALRERPDLVASHAGVAAAQSQVTLAKADAKQDLGAGIDFSHVSGVSSTSLFFNIPLPVFNRNQGEIARTRSALEQSHFLETVAEQGVLTDVRNAYESATTNEEVVKLYVSGYLKQAQDSRDITSYAYNRGGVTLLDLLDAERSYRATELAYRQTLANYMISLEQVKQAIGSRTLP